LWEFINGIDRAIVHEPLAFWGTGIRQLNAIVLPVEASHVEALVRLPAIHKDPFDRMLLAQALSEGLPIVSRDTRFEEYSSAGIEVVW
jgi:PIN domain nuclease of toxin-antitoxin system